MNFYSLRCLHGFPFGQRIEHVAVPLLAARFELVWTWWYVTIRTSTTNLSLCCTCGSLTVSGTVGTCLYCTWWISIFLAWIQLRSLRLRLDDLATCLVTWKKGRTLGCFLCIVLKILGCFTSTRLTVGGTCMFTTCSTIGCWILSWDHLQLVLCVLNLLCVFGTSMIFSTTCVTGLSTICSTTRSTCTFHLSVINLHCFLQDLKNTASTVSLAIWGTRSSICSTVHRQHQSPWSFYPLLHPWASSPTFVFTWRWFCAWSGAVVWIRSQTERTTFDGVAISAARLLSVSHCLVNATVVQLCEVVHHGRQLGVHVRVRLLTCAELCSRLQLCSNAWLLRWELSLAGSLVSSSRSALVVPRQSSAPAGVVVTCSATMFVGRLVCWRGRWSGPSVSCVSLPGPIRVTDSSRVMRHQTANPLW